MKANGLLGRPWAYWEKLFVALVSLHSVGVGVMLLVFTAWTLDFAGWTNVHDHFFPRQSGVFHLIVAVGYWLEHRRNGRVTLMALAKSSAVIFLLVMNPWTGAWSMTFSGVADGLMLVGILVLHRLVLREKAKAAAIAPVGS